MKQEIYEQLVRDILAVLESGKKSIGTTAALISARAMIDSALRESGQSPKEGKPEMYSGNPNDCPIGSAMMAEDLEIPPLCYEHRTTRGAVFQKRKYITVSDVFDDPVHEHYLWVRVK